MYPLPKLDKQVSPYFVFYLVHTMQIGVGVLGFQRQIAKDAGHSAWISVILSGITILMLIWISYRILNRGNNDIIAIHHDVFGKWLGGVISFYFIVYYVMFVLVLVRTYVEVIQVWVFPDVFPWIFLILILFIAYYYVIGGFRVVTGISFLGVIYGLPLLLTLYFPLKDSNFGNLLPIFELTLTELFQSTKTMTLNYLGFEVLFLFYPFIRSGPKSEKWAHFGTVFTIIIYLVIALVSFAYFSLEQLETTTWATLTLWKIVDLAVIERFEYVGICIWFFIVLPNICIGLWCASRAAHRLFPVSQRTSLRAMCFILLLLAILINDRKEIDFLNKFVSQVGFYTIYIYIPLLFIIQYISFKVRKKK
jgi:spore germination protein (amino acid permease)